MNRLYLIFVSLQLICLFIPSLQRRSPELDYEEFITINNIDYLIKEDAFLHDDAFRFCFSRGMQLATLVPQAQFDSLFEYLASNADPDIAHFRTGGVKMNDEWTWLGSGERIDPDDPNWVTSERTKVGDVFPTDVLLMNGAASTKGWSSGFSDEYVNATICERRFN